MDKIKVALIGQPNVGKSTLFNILAGDSVIVTNWPGTTVEKHEGRRKHREVEIQIVDLPGAYGLTYSTIEEKISRDYILREKPDTIVVIVDSLSIERTMYLAIEILELTGRVVLALSKIDRTHSEGIHINYNLLEKSLGTPVIPISAIRKYGIDILLDKVVETAKKSVSKTLHIDYGELEDYIARISEEISGLQAYIGVPLRWLVVKFLEGDQEIHHLIESISSDLYRKLVEIKREAENRLNSNLQLYISSRRYKYLEELTEATISRTSISRRGQDRLLKLLYNPILAPLTSLSILFIVFTCIFIVNTGYPLTSFFIFLGYDNIAEIIEKSSLNGLLSELFNWISEYVYEVIGESTLSKFLVEGVVGSLFALLVFIPLLVIVFTVLGVIEDSGIAPRLAIGLHVFFQKVGLSGHSVFPITLSMGCNVPGIVATRSVLTAIERSRLMLLIPFIPCQARLVVLLAIASSIGGVIGSLLIPMVYIISLLLVITLSYFIYLYDRRRTSGPSLELLLELPPLHRPVPRVIWWFTWFHLKHFLVKAGTIIITANIIAWLVTHITPGFVITDIISESIGFELSSYISPILRPLGIEGYSAIIISFALIMGFIAKEVFLTSLVAVTGFATPHEAIKSLGLSQPSVLALAIFITLYIPCVATLATIHSESKSIKTTLLTLILNIIIAYIMAVIIYNVTLLVL
ncbi:MAG: ferrous iron transport protein B [Desulfurococcaceae archaeon]